MKDVREAALRLEQWISQKGYKGYDPYDVKGSPLIVRLRSLASRLKKAGGALERIIEAAELRIPLALRLILQVRPQRNPKAMGLLAAAYLKLWKLTGEEDYLQKARTLLAWLCARRSRGYSGYAWGYPFHWRSRVFIPRFTPSSVVTATVGDAFWEAAETLGDPRYREVCLSIARFLTEDLNQHEIDTGCACFSYTPLDRFCVHNANLLTAEFLLRIGRRWRRPAYVQLGLRAARYALREQNADGSLCYWGRCQDHFSPGHIDHYHSGFEIRSLYKLWKATGLADLGQAWRRYFRFYRTHLFGELDGALVPKMTPQSLFPINIHSCAEAILCLSTVAPDVPGSLVLAEKVARWVVRHMQRPGGWFVYMLRLQKGKVVPVSIPYMRWGQAWMLCALSTLLCASHQITRHEVPMREVVTAR